MNSEQMQYIRHLYLSKLIALLETEADMDRIERLLDEWLPKESTQ